METYGFSYVECDIPEGVTLGEWRRRHIAHGESRPRLARLFGGRRR